MACPLADFAGAFEAASDVKQAAQRARDGRITIESVPAPVLRPGWVLVATRYSLISAGTERSKVELGGKNLAQKARARPDLARQVVDRARREGLRSTVAAVRERLDTPASIGYSSAGVVLRVGSGVEGLAPGDRVACGGWATHAEIVAVPKNLVAKLPDGVALEDAAYATVGAIALHGIRQAGAELGERVGVIGLGLVGQLAVRLLAAGGCVPVGIDLDPEAVSLANGAGARAFDRGSPGLDAAVLSVTGGLGLDSVLICAAAPSADPVRLAVALARDRGRIVVVGDVPIHADRAAMYEKELEIRLSRSYGPGRYDREYEEQGRDLPPGYVRWTEQRNLQSFLELVARGAVRPSELTTHRFPVEDAARAYATLTGKPDRRPFGILLEYAASEPVPRVRRPSVRPPAGLLRIGVIGAGSFARRTLIPALAKADGVELSTVASERGLTAADAVRRFGFRCAVESAEEILHDDAIDAVVIATRHNTHASLAAAALRAGKAVFVEKPLALTSEDLADVEAALEGGGTLMVGFNRRFAPLTERLRAAFSPVGPSSLQVRVSAGPLPPDHWLHDLEEGGGRLVGEGCHFVDLIAHVGGAPVARVHAFATPPPGRAVEAADDLVAVLRLENGVIASLVYSGSGDASLPKERVEAFGGGAAAVLDDFRRLDVYRGGKRDSVRGAHDKGHGRQIDHFVAVARGVAEAPITESYLNSTRATLALVESLRSGEAVEIE